MRMRILSAAVLAAVTGCTQMSTASLPDARVDDTYHARYWTWTNGQQITFAIKAFEHQGKVALCGARAESPGGDVHTRTFNDRALQTLYVTMGGEVLLNDISFFRKGSYVADAPPNGNAACVLTDRRWSEFYDGVPPELEAAKTRFRVYD